MGNDMNKMLIAVAAVLLIGIFLLAAVLIWLGLGLSHRARRLEEAPTPAEPTGWKWCARSSGTG